MTKCESCVFYQYDENYDDYVCDMDLDEDASSPPRQTAVPTGGPAMTISPPAGSR